MKKNMYFVLCVAVIIFAVAACKKKKDSTTTPTPNCSGLAVTATVSGTTATPTSTGGTSPYQYSLDGTTYVTETQVAGLKYGANTIYVKDANSCTATTVVTSTTVTDSRDGQTYSTATFGNQVWMTKNLNYNVSGSITYYSSVDSATKYGRLYTYAQATQGCPTGWELPSDSAWKTLEITIGMSKADVNHESASLTDRGTSASTIEANTSFNALYAGEHVGSSYYLIGQSSAFWTSISGCNRIVKVGVPSILRYTTTGITDNYSVRCIKSN